MAWLETELAAGSLGRCAIAFFAASMGCAGTIILQSYDGSWSEVIRSIPQGLGAAAIIYGIYLGAVIEFAFWLPSALLSANFKPMRLGQNPPESGKPCDEPNEESIEEEALR